MAYLVRLIFPYRTVKDFETYVEMLRVIEAKHSKRQLTDKDERWHQTIVHRLHLTRLILVSCAQLIYFWFLPSSRHSNKLALDADMIRIAHLGDTTLLLIVLFFFLLHFYFEPQLFYNVNPYFLDYLQQVLIRNNLRHLYLSPYKYRGKCILRSIRRNITYSMNLILGFLPIVYGIGFWMQYLGISMIYTNRNSLSWWIDFGDLPGSSVITVVLALIYFEISYIILVFSHYYLIFISTIIASVSSAVFTAGFMLFGQINERCQQLLMTTHRITHRLVQVLSQERRILVLVLRFTRFYSNLLMPWMMINLPFSGYLFSLVLSHSVPPELVFLPISIIAGQWLGILVVHVLCARLNAALRRPNKSLLHLSARKRKFLLRIRLRLALHIEAFHTLKSYGLSYGSIGGTISMLTFLKSALLYGEVIMCAYQMVNTSV